MGYVFFRSCAVSFLNQPGEYLQDGATYHFPESQVVVEVERAHPEGVLEVVCYIEYKP